MLNTIFATAANSEPLTADRGLKFPVDFENVIRNVPVSVDCNKNVKNVHIQQRKTVALPHAFHFCTYHSRSSAFHGVKLCFVVERPK